MNEELAAEFLQWLDKEHREVVNELYQKFKEQRGPKQYYVFWTFVANYADNPTLVTATSVEEAIAKGYPYDPEARNENGRQARFLVFEVNGKLVHNGYYEDIGKEPCVFDAESLFKTGYDWKKKQVIA
jgi:hypothetical protein